MQNKSNAYFTFSQVFSVFTELTYFVIIYLMVPDVLMWYEEYKGETKPQEPMAE